MIMDQYNKDRGHNATYVLVTLLAGAAIGAVVTALTTNKTGAERRGDLESLARRLRLKAESLTNEANEAWAAVKKYASANSEHFKHHCSPECGDDCRSDNFEPDTKTN